MAVVEEIREVVLRPNTGLSIRAAKSQVFDRTSDFRVSNDMQVVYRNEDERRCSRRSDLVDFVIYTRRIWNIRWQENF